jgi:hypothetical protein
VKLSWRWKEEVSTKRMHLSSNVPCLTFIKTVVFELNFGGRRLQFNGRVLSWPHVSHYKGEVQIETVWIARNICPQQTADLNAVCWLQEMVFRRRSSDWYMLGRGSAMLTRRQNKNFCEEPGDAYFRRGRFHSLVHSCAWFSSVKIISTVIKCQVNRTVKVVPVDDMEVYGGE